MVHVCRLYSQPVLFHISIAISYYKFSIREMALLEIKTVFICNASRLRSKVTSHFVFTHLDGSKPIAAGLLRLVWHIFKAI